MKNTQPPFRAVQLLRWFAGTADLEDILGDLDEVYFDQVYSNGKFRANLFYWRQVFALLFSYALKKRKDHTAYSTYYNNNSMAMIKNYIKIAVRNFSKQKLFTSINIIGLSLGMCICLLALSISIAIYESDEWQANKDRIFQINTSLTNDELDNTFGSTFQAIGSQLEADYPFVEKVVKIHSQFTPEVNHHGNLMNFRGYYADKTFFEVFSFRMIKGNPTTALSEPNSVVITEKVAEKLFRDKEPMGKTIITDLGNFLVTGVMENLKQTHFHFEMLASFETYKTQIDIPIDRDWINYRNNYVYVKVKEGTNNKQLNDALQQLSEKAEAINPTYSIKLESIALDHVVPRWNISNAIGIGWDQPSMLFFMAMGLLVLLPAVFNYINLSIARALKRAKEIGLRKVVGAKRVQIKMQFIVETILLSVVALLGSLMLLYPLKKEFLSMVISSEVLDTDPSFYQILAFLLFSILVGLLTGIFPAQYFSKLNPIQTIKGEIKNGSNNVSGYKKGLFLFQFFLSLVFVIGVLTIFRQYSYVLNNKHGFETDHILTVPFHDMDKQLALHELEQHPDVKAITSSSHLPGLFLSKTIEATSNALDTLDVYQVFIGDQFIENLDIQLVWGESQSLATSNKNEEYVLVNEQFLKSIAVFNVQKDSLSFTLGDGTHCRIVGTLKDFNFEPLSETIAPLMFRYDVAESQYTLLTVNSTDIKRTINELDVLWHGIDQEIYFEARFLNDEIEDAYYFMTVQIKFFSILSALAITISCFGLLGMVSFTTENRTKEIAIRKIMGASNNSLYYLLTKDFLKLILIASFIAVPFSYVFYDKVFLYFLIRYGNGLGVLEVLVSIVFLFLVGLASIYWQTSKVTKANPANKLRYE